MSDQKYKIYWPSLHKRYWAGTWPAYDGVSPEDLLPKNAPPSKDNFRREEFNKLSAKKQAEATAWWSEYITWLEEPGKPDSTGKVTKRIEALENSILLHHPERREKDVSLAPGIREHPGGIAYFRAKSFDLTNKGYSSVNDVPPDLKNRFAQEVLKSLFKDLKKEPLANADILKYAFRAHVPFKGTAKVPAVGGVGPADSAYQELWVLVGVKESKVDGQAAAQPSTSAPKGLKAVSTVDKLGWWDSPDKGGEFFWKPTNTIYTYYTVNTGHELKDLANAGQSHTLALFNDPQNQVDLSKALFGGNPDVQLATTTARALGHSLIKSEPLVAGSFNYCLSKILSKHKKAGIYLLDNENITDEYKTKIIEEKAKFLLDPVKAPKTQKNHVKWERKLGIRNNDQFEFDSTGNSLYWNDSSALADWSTTGDRPTDTILVFFAIPKKYIEAFPSVSEEHFKLAEPPFDEVVFAPHIELEENAKILEKIIEEYVDVIEDEGPAGVEIYIEGDKFFSEWVKGKEIVEYVEDPVLPDLLRLHAVIKNMFAKEPYNITFQKEDKLQFKFKKTDENPYILSKVIHIREQTTTALSQNDTMTTQMNFVFPVWGAALINLNGIVNKYNAGMRVGYKKFLTEQMFPDYKELFVYKPKTPLSEKIQGAGKSVWETLYSESKALGQREFVNDFKRQQMSKKLSKAAPSADKSVAANVGDSLKVVSSIDDIYDQICRKFNITDIAADLVKCLREKNDALDTALAVKDVARQIRKNPKKLRAMVESVLLGFLKPPGEEPMLSDTLINGDKELWKKEHKKWCDELEKKYPGKKCQPAAHNEYKKEIKLAVDQLKTIVICIDFPIEDENTFFEKPIKKIIEEVGDWIDDPAAAYDSKQLIKCASNIAATGLAMAGASDSIDKFRKNEFVNNKYIKITGNDVPFIGQRKGARHTHTGTPQEFETDINKAKRSMGDDPWAAIEKAIIETILRIAFESLKLIMQELVGYLRDLACKSDDDDKKKPDGNPGDLQLPADDADPNDPKWKQAASPLTPEGMTAFLKSVSARLTPRELCHLMNGEYYNENTDVATIIQKLIRKLDKSGGWGIEKAGIYSKSSIAKYFKKLGEAFPEKFSIVCKEALKNLEDADAAARANRELCKDLSVQELEDLKERLEKLGLSDEDINKIIKNSKVKDLAALEAALDFMAEENFLDDILDQIVIDEPEAVKSAVEKSINGVFGGVEKSINAYLMGLFFKSYSPISDFNLAVNYLINGEKADKIFDTLENSAAKAFAAAKSDKKDAAAAKLSAIKNIKKMVEGNYIPLNPLIDLFASDNFYEKYLDPGWFSGDPPLVEYKKLFDATKSFNISFRAITANTAGKSKAWAFQTKSNFISLGDDVEIVFDDKGEYYQVFLWDIPMFLDFTSTPGDPLPEDRAPLIHNGQLIPGILHALKPVVKDSKLRDYIKKKYNTAAIQIQKNTTSGAQQPEVFNKILWEKIGVVVNDKGSMAGFKSSFSTIRGEIRNQLLGLMPNSFPEAMFEQTMSNFYLEDFYEQQKESPKSKKQLRKYKAFLKENSLVPVEKIKKDVLKIYEKK